MVESFHLNCSKIGQTMSPGIVLSANNVIIPRDFIHKVTGIDRAFSQSSLNVSTDKKTHAACLDVLVQGESSVSLVSGRNHY